MFSNQVRTLIVLLLFLVLSACGGQVTPPKKNLVVVSYGGGAYQESHKKAFCESFADITGSEVESSVWNADYGKLKAMVDSGDVPWDVLDVTAAQFARGQKENMFSKLQLTIQDCEFLPSSISEYGIPNVYWSTVLAYRKETFASNPPKTWKDFWNVRDFPGERAMYDDPRGNLEFALLADGVPLDKLYPLDVDRAFKKLDEIKSHIRVWWNDGTEPVQLLLNKSVVITSAWNGRIYASDQARRDIGYSWEGAAQELDYWVIPRGSKSEKLASMFILYASLPQPLARQTEIVGYGPVNTAAFKYVSDDAKPHLPTYGPNWQVSFVVNAEWWSENEEQVKARWLSWKGK